MDIGSILLGLALLLVIAFVVAPPPRAGAWMRRSRLGPRNGTAAKPRRSTSRRRLSGSLAANAAHRRNRATVSAPAAARLWRRRTRARPKSKVSRAAGREPF